jgi:hypothetical protein
LTLENGTVLQNNQASGGAGATPTFILKNGFGGNAFGAGVYVAGGTANITGATIDNNVAAGGNGGPTPGVNFPPDGKGGNASGGGLYIAAGTVTLSSDTVDGNQANGGNQQLGDNGGSAYGGGIYLAGGTVTLSNDTVTGNSATWYWYGPNIHPLIGSAGGGIYIASQATATLCIDTVESNSARAVLDGGISLDFGGGIYIGSGATVYIDSFTVAHTINNTDISGLNGPTANIDGSYILQNC